MGTDLRPAGRSVSAPLLSACFLLRILLVQKRPRTLHYAGKSSCDRKLTWNIAGRSGYAHNVRLKVHQVGCGQGDDVGDARNLEDS